MTDRPHATERRACIALASLDERKNKERITVAGWVRSKRETKARSFIMLNDGTASHNLQIVCEHSHFIDDQRRVLRVVTTGAAIIARGIFVRTPNRPQPYELQCAEFTLCGGADPEQYPLQKKEHSHEFLRTIPHLRARSATYGAIARIRSSLSYAIHHFFHTRHFWYLHTPIVTTHDAEGAGALFRITAAQSASEGTEFFGAPAYLTVSGQLNAESYALAMGKVYTFGPTFRAEDSHTGRHLSEFWMVEAEISFCDLAGLLLLAEEFVKEIVRAVLEERRDDIDLLALHNPALRPLLSSLVDSRYEVMEYGSAISALQNADAHFEYEPQWGADLQSEHEKWLLTHCGERPLFIINYPERIKPFYMRCNDDGQSVRAVDLIVPEVGELIGGSQREERYQELFDAMRARDIDTRSYQWYLDTRRYGGAPHSGFGLGFDRLVQLVCGIANIRDAIPFPRTPGQALC